MSLKKTIFITLMIILILTTGFNYVIAIAQLKDTIRRNVAQAIDNQIKDLQSAYLLIDSLREFEVFVESHTENLSDTMILITDAPGDSVILSSSPSPNNVQSISTLSGPINAVIKSTTLKDIVHIYDQYKQQMTGIAPLCVSDDCPKIIYQLDLNPRLNEGQHIVIKQSAIYFICCLLGFLLIILMTHHRLTRRLNLFNQVIEDWRIGKKSKRINLVGSDELSKIANTFDYLIDELQEEEKALIESKEFNRAIIESANYAIISTDVLGVIKTINSATTMLIGYTEDEIVGQHTPLLFLAPECLSDTALSALPSLHKTLPINRKEPLSFIQEDTVFLTKFNQRIAVHISLSPMLDRGGRHSGYLCIASDISQAKLAERQLRLAASVYSHSSQAIIIVDDNQQIIDSNARFKELMGGTDETINLSPAENTLASRHSPAFFNYIWRQTVTNGHWSGEVWQKNKRGEEFPTLVTMHCIDAPKGSIESVIILSQDIADKKKAEQELEKMAYLDSLTNLPNRFLYRDRLEQALDQASRSKNGVALMFLDLDRFKAVNDNFGHEVGDELLIEVSRRLKQTIRKGDTLSRLGGDEFTIILANLPAQVIYRDSSHSARRILSIFDQPFVVGRRKLYISVSIGIAVFPNDGDDFSSLSRNADTAMYQAKESDNSNYKFFDIKMMEENFRRIEIETELRRDLNRGNLEVHYQPIIDISSNRVAGFEALCRWQHSNLVVYPDEFIPIAEEVGLINKIGHFVLQEACKTLKMLETVNPDLYVALNVSAQQFKATNFGSELLSTLHFFDVSPTKLELEITESVLLEDDAHIAKTISHLADVGVKLALDDFGTGYSSLSYLKNYPISTLKIDKSFIQNARVSETDLTIIRAIQLIAQTLKIKVVAEGVEIDRDLDIVRSENINFVQGFIFSKALPASELEAFLTSKS